MSTQNTQSTEQFHTHVILGAGSWGRGSTLREAKDNYRANFGNLNRPHIIYSFPQGVEFDKVTDFGEIYWTYTDEDKPVQPTKTERRIPKKG